MATEKTKTTKETQVADNKMGKKYDGIKNFVYVGPSLPGGMLKSNTVFVGSYEEITSYYKTVLGEYPSAAKLIVPVSELADVSAKVQTNGNILRKYYDDIVFAINNKKEE